MKKMETEEGFEEWGTLISRRMWRSLSISKRGNCVSRDIQVSVGMIHVEYRFFFENHKKSGWISRRGNSRVAGRSGNDPRRVAVL